MQQGTRQEDHLDFISDLVRGGSDLHALSLSGLTPMLEVLAALKLSLGCMSIRTSDSAISMRIWLQLKISGVDLSEYGKEERLVIEEPGVDREFGCSTNHRDRARWILLRLINFIYGPEPNDWIFWFEPVIEEYFMDFWRMINHPEKTMPGAWEDDSDFNDDFDY
jgi:hypothetical protein